MQYASQIKRRSKPISARTMGYRVSQQEYDFVSKYVESRGMTISELLEQAVKLYFDVNLKEKKK